MLNESLRIEAPPQAFWPMVADLGQLARWNAKLASVEPRSDGGPRVGYTCRTVWRMSGRERQFVTRIETCDPPRLVVFVHQDEADGRRIVREHFELAPAAQGTRVRHRLDLSQSGIPIVARWLIALIGRFGTASGATVLETLRDEVVAQPR